MLFTNPPVNSDDLFICYDECLRQVVDSNATLETKVKRGRRSERWYTAESKEVKAETRQLERIYRIYTYCSGSYTRRLERIYTYRSGSYTMVPTIQH